MIPVSYLDQRMIMCTTLQGVSWAGEARRAAIEMMNGELGGFDVARPDELLDGSRIKIQSGTIFTDKMWLLLLFFAF